MGESDAIQDIGALKGRLSEHEGAFILGDCFAIQATVELKVTAREAIGAGSGP